jgi:hypothetical protein
MKRYIAYSQQELADMDEATIQKLIDIEVAHAEIEPVAAPLPYNAERLGIQKKVEAFKVHGTIYATKKDAEVARGLKIMRSNYDCAAGWGFEWVEPMEDVNIDVVHYYRKEDVVQNAGHLRDLSNQQSKYKKEETAYKDYLKVIGEHRDKVKAAWYAALERQQRIAKPA